MTTCVFIHFPFCPYLHPGAALWGLLNDRTSLNALTHATTRIQNVWHLWVCPLKISFRMVFIFNVAPILGVRCKQNVDERNPPLSLPSCLCRVMRPLHNLSTWKQSNAGTASVRLIKINSWFNTAPFKALQPCNSLARAIKLTWILLGSCDSNGQCYKKENICNCNLKSWQLNLFFLQAATNEQCKTDLCTNYSYELVLFHKSLAIYSLVSLQVKSVSATLLRSQQKVKETITVMYLWDLHP